MWIISRHLFCTCYVIFFCYCRSVMEMGKSANESILSTPTQTAVQNIGCDSLNSSLRTGTPIRPLTAAYKAASNEHDVSIYDTWNPCHVIVMCSASFVFLHEWWEISLLVWSSQHRFIKPLVIQPTGHFLWTHSIDSVNLTPCRKSSYIFWPN